MWLPRPECSECSCEIEPFNQDGMCGSCYEKSHCADCDMGIEPKQECPWCNMTWLGRKEEVS